MTIFYIKNERLRHNQDSLETNGLVRPERNWLLSVIGYPGMGSFELIKSNIFP